MSTKELLKLVAERGLTIELQDGRPVLKGASKRPGAATDKLLRVLKLHRDRIIELLQRKGN
jgi:hypothetical protein